MSRTFGQHCGVARALELVGERWGLLVVRDLVLGPKRFTELRRGLPRIPASILSARLNELEEAGVVRRRILPQLDASVVYELTAYGSELEGLVLQLGLWGARSLGDRAEDEVVTVDSAILALRATFRPERSHGARASYELHHGPAVVLDVVVDDGVLEVSGGGRSDADLVLHVPGTLTPLLTGETTPAEAIRSGLVRIEGDPRLLDLFVEVFHLPSALRPVEGLAVH